MCFRCRSARVVRREELGLDLGCPECGIDGLGRIVELDRHKMQWLGILVVRYKDLGNRKCDPKFGKLRMKRHKPKGSMYLYNRYLSLKGVPIWVL